MSSRSIQCLLSQRGRSAAAEGHCRGIERAYQLLILATLSASRTGRRIPALKGVDIPIDEDEGNAHEDQSEPQYGQGDASEGQGDSGDDGGVGIGIVPPDN